MRILKVLILLMVLFNGRDDSHFTTVRISTDIELMSVCHRN